MRHAVTTFFSATAIFAIAMTATSADRTPNQGERSPTTLSRVDTSNLIWQNARQLIEIENDSAPIKSQADLAAYLRTTPANQNPINLLSHGAQDRFVKSLAFNEAGLTSFDYGDLRAELSASQIYRLLSLFGMQHTVNAMTGIRVESPEDKLIKDTIMTPQDCTSYPSPEQCPGGDHEGYYCQSAGTCTVRANSICTHNC